MVHIVLLRSTSFSKKVGHVTTLPLQALMVKKTCNRIACLLVEKVLFLNPKTSSIWDLSQDFRERITMCHQRFDKLWKKNIKLGGGLNVDVVDLAHYPFFNGVWI